MRSGRRNESRLAGLAAAFLIAGCSATSPSGQPSFSPSTTSTLGGSVAPPTNGPTPSTSAAESPGPGSSPAAIGRWEAGPDIVTPRLQTHVVPLGSSALVVGADNICTPGAAWESSALSEIWLGRGDSWVEGPSLPRPRDRFVLAPLPDGSVLVVGGLTDIAFGQESARGPASFRSTFKLAEDSDAWSRSGDLNSARSAPAGSVLKDGRILVAGGYYSDLPDNPPVRVISSAELFDPDTETWSRTGSLREGRWSASAVTLADGRVLIAGGNADIHPEAEGPVVGATPMASTELFDPGDGRFSPTGALPWPAAEAPLVALPDGGALIVFDGRAARFDVSTGEWIELPPMGLQTGFRTAVALRDGRVLVAGGDLPKSETTAPDEGTPFSPRAEIYDPTSNGWTEIVAMPSGRASAAGVLLDDGSVLIAGGWGAVGALGDPYCPEGSLATVRYIPD